MSVVARKEVCLNVNVKKMNYMAIYREQNAEQNHTKEIRNS